MSNFSTIEQLNGGLAGTAPDIYSASTEDNLATITTAGYMNDLAQKFKQNDVLYINYSDTSTFPLSTGAASTLGEFYVNYSASNWSLVNALTALGTAAAKNVTDNTKALVASVTGTFVVDDFVLAADTSGTIKPSGFNINNINNYASVAVTAAEFNGMYAAPKLLVAAPGANRLIVVSRAYLIMTYGSAQYASGGAVYFQYDSTANGAGIKASNQQQASDYTGAAASTTFGFNGPNSNASEMPFATTVNKGLYLSNATAAFTTGNSNFIVKIFYHIIATA